MTASGGDWPPTWMREEDAAQLSARLHEALQAEDWESVVELIETEWSSLMAIAVTALDAALRALPAHIWPGHPTATAVKEIRLNFRGDTAEFDRLAMKVPLPSQPDELRRVGRSDGARRAMSTAGAFMLAYRVHGQHRKALHFANITEELTRHARVSRPQEISIRVPSALLQVGITRMLAGDYHRASLILREAYELRHETWDGRVGGDAAGKLALLFAVRGETVEAERWLSRHDDGAGALGWMVPLVQLSAKIAAALIAIDRLDRAAADAALRTLELQVNRERSWAPFVAFAHARYGLFWGDQRAALERIERTRAFTGDAHRNAGIEPRLDAVKVNLLLAVERSAEAHELLAERRGSPHLVPTASRLALLSGQKAAARDLGAAGLSVGDIDPRAQVDLLVTSALAEDSPETGRRYLQQAIATAVRARSLAPFALAHRSSLKNLMGQVPSSPGRYWIEATLSSAPEPMPGTVEVVELTSKELGVLRSLADGASRPMIAQQLFVSDNTVKFHIRNVYRKLGVASREDAVAKARQLRLLGSPGTDE